MVTSEELLRPPLDGRILCTLVVIGGIAAAATVSSVHLAASHLRAGQKVTGTLAPVARSISSIKLVMAVPVFALVSICSFLMAESQPLWMFLNTLVLARVISEIPNLYLDVAGGAVRLQLAMQEYRQRRCEPLRLFGHPPLCCCAPFCRARLPDATDLPWLRLGIQQFVLIQPLLAFLELFLGLERLEGAAFTSKLDHRKPWITLIRVLSNFSAMSSMRGLAVLVAATSKRAESHLHLQDKQKYGQCFLLGMHLLPTLLHGCYGWIFSDGQLANGYTLSPIEMSRLSLSVVLCLTVGLCAKVARRAFPADSGLYPELAVGGAEQLAGGGAATVQFMLTPEEAEQVESARRAAPSPL